MNFREYRKGNQKWTIQRNWQHRVDKTKKKQNKNKAQNVLDTTIHRYKSLIIARLSESNKNAAHIQSI